MPTTCVVLDHDERRDLAADLLKRLRDQRVGGDGAGLARHDLGDRRIEREAGLEMAAQVAVGDDADQPAVVEGRRRSQNPWRTSPRSRPPFWRGPRCAECVRPCASRRAHGCSLAPSLPPGCRTRKSRAVKPRPSSSAIASASPSTSCIVVEVVGARPFGQASSASGKAQADVRLAAERAVRAAQSSRSAEWRSAWRR